MEVEVLDDFFIATELAFQLLHEYGMLYFMSKKRSDETKNSLDTLIEYRKSGHYFSEPYKPSEGPIYSRDAFIDWVYPHTVKFLKKKNPALKPYIFDVFLQKSKEDLGSLWDSRNFSLTSLMRFLHYGEGVGKLFYIRDEGDFHGHVFTFTHERIDDIVPIEMISIQTSLKNFVTGVKGVASLLVKKVFDFAEEAVEGDYFVFAHSWEKMSEILMHKFNFVVLEGEYARTKSGEVYPRPPELDPASKCMGDSSYVFAVKLVER